MDIMTLLMAQRGGGSGGGSGGGVNSVNGIAPDSAGNVALKYDDLENKPFYEEIGEVCFVSNKTAASIYASSYGAYVIQLQYALDEMPLTGDCKVVWDGVTRTHTIIQAELQGAIYHGFGNLSMFAAFGITAPNTGEPYAFLVNPDGTATVFTTDTAATEHTLSVYANDIVYHGPEQVYLDIPTLDFTELGTLTVESGTPTIVGGNFSAALDVLRKNWIVKVRFAANVANENIGECICAALVQRTLAKQQATLEVIVSDYPLVFIVSPAGIIVALKP